MDILVKEMEMPKNCVDCPFSKSNVDLGINDSWHLFCVLPTVAEFVTDYEDIRHPSCPLVEVPDSFRKRLVSEFDYPIGEK